MDVVPNESTPFLIGLEVLREYGLVIDYQYNPVYSHVLNRYLPCAAFPTGHLALEKIPRYSEQGQRQVLSQALSNWRWDKHSRAQEKGTLPFESSTFHLREEPEHEHKHVSTSEDDLLKILKPGPVSTEAHVLLENCDMLMHTLEMRTP